MIQEKINKQKPKVNKPINKNLIPEDPIEPDLTEYPDDIKEEIKNYWRLIKTSKTISDLLDHSYNFHWSKVMETIKIC